MKKVLLLPACILWQISLVFCQKEGNVWHFGNGKAISFNSGAPIQLSTSAMQTFEGSATICDVNGNLLFYTNGGGRDPLTSGQSSGKIWNRNHAVMYDMGFTEGGGFSAAQSSVIIPKPGSPGRYYLFTMEEVEFNVGGAVATQPQGRGLSFFEIDMSLNGGLGGVANYTESILLPSYEGVCAVRHSNGSDYWILAHNNESGLAVVPVGATGVGTPTLFNLPSGTGGVIKASPDGRWVATNLPGPGYLLCQFDPSGGVISNPLVLPQPFNGSIASASFSPNSKRLFVIDDNQGLAYYDLSVPDINASRVEVATLPAGIANGQMQLGPDGKIYFIQNAFFLLETYLSAIVCPNSTPFVESKVFTFSTPGNDIFFGLPNFDDAIFRRDEDPPLLVNLGADRTLCGDEVIALDAGISNASYTWSNGAQTQSISVDAPGLYVVTVTTPGCGVGIDTVVVNAVNIQPNAGPDLLICRGESAQLQGSANGEISWTPADLVSDPNIPAPIFTGSNSAVLILSASSDGCTQQDTVQVTVSDLPTLTLLSKDTTIIAGKSVQLNATSNGTYQWIPSDGLSCTDCANPIATPLQTTTYILTVLNAAGCSETASVTITVNPPDCEPDVPNAFTPNGDMINDGFAPLGTAIESYQLAVFNRWGKVVYEGNGPWDGRFSNEDAPADVYAFRMSILICGKELTYDGDVTVIR
jgi:gliding motility-associated-like protein